jgi:hypothetical protein
MNATYTPVTQHIQVGRKSAVTRKTLMAKTGFTDRTVRGQIEAAVNDGMLIVNLGEGGGYYVPDDDADIIRYYQQECHRIRSIAAKLRPFRRYLDSRQMAGQLEIGVCLRCAEPIKDGYLCDDCEQKLNARKG